MVRFQNLKKERAIFISRENNLNDSCAVLVSSFSSTLLCVRAEKRIKNQKKFILPYIENISGYIRR